MNSLVGKKALFIAAGAMMGVSAFSGAAHAQCALEGGGRSGTLQSTHFLWFGDAARAKGGNRFASIKNDFSAQFSDPEWYGKTITAKPSANNRLAVYKDDGSHAWVEAGKTGTLDAKTIGVGCHAIAKKP